jgi:phage terminase small subunit
VSVQLARTNHDLFLHEYIARGARLSLAGAAAEAAGLEPRSAQSTLALPHVKARLQQMLLEHFGELEITAKRTFEEIARIAFSDPAELFDENGDMLPLHKMTPSQRAAIASIDFETVLRGRGNAAMPVTTVKIKLWDKPGALKVLAQHYKIINDDKEGLNALAGELAVQLRAGRERAQTARRAPTPITPLTSVVDTSLTAVEDARIIPPVNPATSATSATPVKETEHEQIW